MRISKQQVVSVHGDRVKVTTPGLASTKRECKTQQVYKEFSRFAKFKLHILTVWNNGDIYCF